MKIQPKPLYSSPPYASTFDLNLDDEVEDNPEDKEQKEWGGEPESEEGGGTWPYLVEITFDRLDHDERKWLLFQLVCCQPQFLKEVKLGFPLSLISDEDEQSEIAGMEYLNLSEGTEVEVQVREMEKENHRDKGKPGVLIPIVLPKEEWLLTYCQVDRIPSSTRDEFLLNLFLMSRTHASILTTYQESLETGKEFHSAYDTHGDTLGGNEMERWKKEFKKQNDARKVKARSGMGIAYGGFRYWEEVGKDREGVWDIALAEIGRWLMRSLPVPNELNQRLPRDSHDGAQDDFEPIFESEVWKVAQDHIQIMAFMVETKILSLLQSITRRDSASDDFIGRSRYKFLAIKDLTHLARIISRSPIPLRKLLGGLIESVSAEIIVLMGELDEADGQWIRVDEDLAWSLRCVMKGLDEVQLDRMWMTVMDLYQQG